MIDLFFSPAGPKMRNRIATEDCSSDWFSVKENDPYKVVINFFDGEIANINPSKSIYRTGWQFKLITDFLNNELEEFDNIRYVGFFDDDLVIDKKILIDACNYAYNNSIDLFQFSLSENSHHNHELFKNNPNLEWAKVSWIDGMCPIMRYDQILKYRDWLNYAKIVQHGWGTDILLSQIVQADAYVLHNFMITHPYTTRCYSNDEAKIEADEILGNIGPMYLKEKFNIDWKWNRDLYIYQEKFLDGTFNNDVQSLKHYIETD